MANEAAVTSADYVSAKGLVELIPLSERHLSERVSKRKDFPRAYRVGSKRYWLRSEVSAWFEGQKES